MGVFDTFQIILITESCLSIIFLFLLIFVYCRRNEHQTTSGKNMISLSVSQIGCYTALLAQLTAPHISNSLPCHFMAGFTHFVYLAGMMWSNVLAYDIMFTVTNMRPSMVCDRLSSRYMRYSVYAWLTTIVIWIPSVVTDYLNLLPKDYSPGFATGFCYMNNIYGYIIFFSVPVVIIMSVNIIFFANTLRTIKQVRNLTSQFEIKQKKETLCLYVKLILVMGLIRITLIIGAIFPNIYVNTALGCLNSLYGVYMFVVLICKRPTMKRLKRLLASIRTPQMPEPGSQRGRSESVATISTDTII